MLTHICNMLKLHMPVSRCEYVQCDTALEFSLLSSPTWEAKGAPVPRGHRGPLPLDDHEKVNNLFQSFLLLMRSDGIDSDHDVIHIY